MNKINFVISIFIAATAAISTPTVAQDSGATVEFNALTATGVVVGKRVIVDAEFGAEHGLDVPAAFNFIAPTGDDHLLFGLPAPGGTGLYKVFFATKAEESTSNIQFIPFTVGMGPIEERLDALPELLRSAFIASVEDTEQAAINATRAVQIGPYPAVEMLGNYKSVESGIVVLRIVAIPNPDSEHGMIAIINGITKNFPMESVEDVMRTNASRALTTFKFQ